MKCNRVLGSPAHSCLVDLTRLAASGRIVFSEDLHGCFGEKLVATDHDEKVFQEEIQITRPICVLDTTPSIQF